MQTCNQLLSSQASQWCIHTLLFQHGLFCVSPLCANFTFMDGLVEEGAEESYLGFLAVAPELTMHPLTEFHKEWCHNCTLWMDGQGAETGLFTSVLQHR